MRYLTHLQHLGKHLGNLDTRGTNKHGSAVGAHQLDFLDDSLVLLALRTVDAVVHVYTYNRTVRRHLNNIKLIDVPELACFGDGCTCHTSKLVVHAEVVLQGNSRVCLRGSLYLHMFLCLDGLMQAIAPTAAFHDTTCLLIHNLDFTVLNNVLVVEVEHCIGLQQLLYGVYALALGCIVVEDAILLFELLLVCLA